MRFYTSNDYHSECVPVTEVDYDLLSPLLYFQQQNHQSSTIPRTKLESVCRLCLSCISRCIIHIYWKQGYQVTGYLKQKNPRKHNWPVHCVEGIASVCPLLMRVKIGNQRYLLVHIFRIAQLASPPRSSRNPVTLQKQQFENMQRVHVS